VAHIGGFIRRKRRYCSQIFLSLSSRHWQTQQYTSII